jgi:hypothetical protein
MDEQKRVSEIKWRTKLTQSQKLAMRNRAEERRKRLNPTIDDVKADPNRYLSKLTPRAQAVIRGILERGFATTIDHRDLRTVPVFDRVPRSLECPLTPPGYWSVDDF